MKKYAFFAIIFISLFLYSCSMKISILIPQNLEAESIGETNAKIRWDYYAKSDGFEIQRKTENGSFETIAKVSGKSFEDTNLEADKVYYYRVRAIKGLKKSDWSYPLKIRTLERIPHTPYVEGMDLLKLERKIVIRWKNTNRSDVQFEIMRWSDREQPKIIGYSENEEFEDDDVLEGITYYYKIRARKGDYTSEWSEPVSITVDIPIPVLISDLRIDEISPTEVRLKWDCSLNNLDGFEIWKSEDGKDEILVARVSGNSKAFVDRDVEQEKTYRYKIQGYRGVSKTNPGIMIVKIPPKIVLRKVEDFNVVDVTSHSIYLSWKYDGNDHEGFEIERKTNDTNFVKIASCGKDSRYYEDNNLSPSTRYYYRIRAFNEEGYSEWSVVVTTMTLEYMK